MFKEAIIIAGGKGTRLKSVYSEGPKPMVPVNGVPFLTRLMEYLKQSGIARVILATGYMHEKIEEHYGNSCHGMALAYSVETEPLGTGGAIAQALKKATKPEVLVLNGDSFFDVDLQRFFQEFEQSDASVQLALKRLPDVARYGTVVLDESGTISSFNEKGAKGSGLINGGVYALKVADVMTVFPTEPFSFEYDFLAPEQVGILKRGQEFDGKFIDIGTPESLKRAETLFS